MSAESKQVKRKLFRKDSSRENGAAANMSEMTANPLSSIVGNLRSLKISRTERENQNGEWLRNHPWKTEKPNSRLKMSATVSNSDTYPTPPKWTKCGSKLVDLAKIYANLPSFVEEVMPESINSGREELRQFLHTSLIEQTFDTPHVKEIMNESYTPLDQEVLKKEDEKFTASSLNLSPEADPVGDNFYYFDCEYMLKVYVPSSKLSWFRTQINSDTRWIKKIKCENYMGKRWVFTPSFRRAKIALLQWPHDESVNDDSTIRILVVRPSEFNAYVTYCGPHFPVIRLPQDEIGAGYARFWIQKIALRLELQFIWMIDDSVLCFFEYHPHRKPPDSYKNSGTRKFGLVFERIENFVKETVDEEVPIVAMSPGRFCVRNPLQQPFVCKPPQGAVYLNLRKLNEKNIWYRPELKTFEDMMFGYECEQRNLKVFRDNRIHLHDYQWKDTGASRPSVKRRKLQRSSSLKKQEPQRSPSVEKQESQSSSSAKKQNPEVAHPNPRNPRRHSR